LIKPRIVYSTWYDCCGFGFRHIISEREFTRSFAIDRKIKELAGMRATLLELAESGIDELLRAQRSALGR
jgi:hypothetical protein